MRSTLAGILIGTSLAFIGHLGLSGVSVAQPPITEDSPSWNCATMGDHVCGPNVTPAAPRHCWSKPVPPNSEWTPGSRVWLQGQNTTVMACSDKL